jgi:hypothetical protein
MIYFNPVEKSQEDKLNDMTKKVEAVAPVDGQPVTPDDIAWEQ